MNQRTEDHDGIGLARSDEEVRSCFLVMRELRTQIVESEFVKLVRGSSRKEATIWFFLESTVT